MIDESFVKKYKQQFYQGNYTIQQLKQQQKNLRGLLTELNQKVTNILEKVLRASQLEVNSALKKGKSSSALVQNPATAEKQKPLIRLPSLVTEAEIKNCQSYRKVLQIQKLKLEQLTLRNLKHEKENIDDQIKEKKQRLQEMMKKNKNENRQINKLGSMIVGDIVSCGRVHKDLEKQVLEKSRELETKKNRLAQVQIKNQKYEKEIEELDYGISSICQKIQIQEEESCEILETGGESRISPSVESRVKQSAKKKEKLVEKEEKLRQKVQKMKANIESIKNRKNQQYFLKLKQLQKQVKKIQSVDKEYTLLKFKLEMTVQQRENEALRND